VIVGVDFGTTNSGAAVYNGREMRLLSLDPAADNQAVFRTAIYITRGREFHMGSQAVNLYFHQNIGRPSRFHKVWVGEILQIFAELPAFYRDVYVYEDEFSPGRLFLSIKTALRNPNYLGTVFQEQWYSASDLAGIFLMGLKLRADQQLGKTATEVVLGRPVFFSSKPDEDKIAQSRLLDAAFKAGFEKVYFEYEPVAAALSYERSLERPQVVLVFDFGGGTLDFTIMKVGQGKQERRVLATGGIPVAGDIFDQRLFRVTLPRHLGEGEYFVQDKKRYPIPSHIFDLLTNAQEIISLNTPQNLEMLRSIHLGAQHKQKIEALMKIVSSNYALLLFDVVERAKRKLSSALNTTISVKTEAFDLEEFVTRARFERAIHQEYEAIRSELLTTLERSGLKPAQIDRVVRTGGSSQIPLFVNLLEELFGAEKVRAIDVFSSVTSGLAVRAFEIEKGLAEAEAWTPDRLQKTETITGKAEAKSEVEEIDLANVRRRMEVAEAFDEGRAALPEKLMMMLGGGRLEISAFPANAGEIPAQANDWARQGFLAAANLHALFATDSYRLQSHELTACFVARLGSESGLYDLLHLEESADRSTLETVTAVAAWDAQAPGKRFLCLATNSGQVRSFEARLMAETIRPRPYFQLEKRYTGVPARLALAGEEDLVVVGSDQGRVGWVPARKAQVVTWEALRAKRDERVCALGIFQPGQALLALSREGTALPFDLQNVPAEGAPGERGSLLKRNFSIAGFASLEALTHGGCYALTSLGCLMKLSLPGTPLSTGTPFRMVELDKGESVITVHE
jgi:hypothetical chaperone protein